MKEFSNTIEYGSSSPFDWCNDANIFPLDISKNKIMITWFNKRN